jgi:hypothetical protein
MYLTPEGIYAAVVSDKGHAAGIRCFFVPSAASESQGSALTAAARQVLQQAGVCDDFAAAVRGSLINQYDLHSEFTDSRQIESTIRFDAEEAAATDASSLAVTFEITASGETGSDITAYTADRQTLTDILLDLQAGGVDPTVLEPDTVCLARVMEKTGLAEAGGKMFLLIFGSTCFLLIPSGNFAPKVRTFLLPEDADKTAALSRQTILMAAGLSAAGAVKTLVLVNSPQDIDTAEMSKRTGMQVESLELTSRLNLQTPYELPAEQAGGFLFACGSAMALAGRTRRADFRRDFMPYQGRRRLLQKSLKVVSISLTILFVILGLYFQTRAMRMKSYTSQLHERLNNDYTSAMYGKKLPPSESVGSRLRRELKTVKDMQQYGLVEGSVVARLTYVLEAINSSPLSVDVNIKTLTISERTISLIGDTNSRKSTRELFDAIKKHNKLDVTEERFNANGNRDEFVVSLKIKESK